MTINRRYMNYVKYGHKAIYDNSEKLSSKTHQKSPEMQEN
jgi:hypothetical protein